jgi:hypothetical protein
MAKKRRRPGAKQAERTRATSSRPWWKRRLVWVGSVLAAVLTATLVNVLTGQAQKTIDAATAPRYDGPPIRVASVSVEKSDEQGFAFVFPNKMEFGTEELRSLNDPKTYSDQARHDNWFRSRGGVDPGLSIVKAVLEGNRAHPVRITGMRPIKHCQAPLLGTIFDSPPAGADASIAIGFDLDSARPTAQVITDTGTWQGDYFAKYTVSLKPGEQQTFQIKSKTERQYCEYTLALTILDEGKTVTQVLDNNGGPFRVTAFAWEQDSTPYGRYQAVYVGGHASPNGDWIRVNPTYNPLTRKG